jgi:hypothetical protein
MKTLSPIETRQKVLSLLQWTELEWTAFQYSMGEAYLERTFRDIDPSYFQALRKSPAFWRWWTNQWNFRDECFTDYAYALSYHHRSIRYKQLHGATTVKSRPHKIILEEIHAQVEREITVAIKNLLCQN